MLFMKRIAAASLAFGTLFAGSVNAAGQTESATVAHNTPKFVKTARIMGPVDPSTLIDVSIWLKPHDQAGLDALAKQLYDPSSSQYRHFLTKAQYSARFAPTAAEAGQVRQFLAANKMKVVTVGPDNFYVRATGTAAAISAAFHTDLNNYEVNGKTVRANAADPTIEGEAARLVAAVYGLDTMEYKHPNASWKTLPAAITKQGGGGGVTSSSTAAPGVTADVLPASDFNSNCLPGQTTETFTTNGDGELPKATYKGNEYTPANSGCGLLRRRSRKRMG
jgi:kumamolisin